MSATGRALMTSVGLPHEGHALIECSPFPMVELEGDQHIVRHANSLFCRLIGRSKDSIVGKPYADVVPDRSSLVVLDRVYRSRTCERHGEPEKIHAQPEEWSYIVWPVNDTADHPTGVVMQVTGPTWFQRARTMNEALMISVVHQHERTDVAEALNVRLEAEIVERQRIEAELSQSEARFRALVAMSTDWYWEQDENLRFTSFSNSIDERASWSANSSLGKTRWEISAIGASEAQWEQHRTLLERHEPFRNFEYRWPSERDGIIWVSVSGNPIFDATGKFKGYRGTGRNITARKAVEAALRESEERLNLAQSAARVGIWDWDLRMRWMAANGRTTFNDDGKPIRISGVVRDITESKLAEQQLRDSEARQAFLLRLGDALSPLDNPEEVKTAAARLLGEHLGVNRALYADVDGDDWVVAGAYCQGVPPLPPGRYAAANYGRWIMDRYRAGQPIIFRDTRSNTELDPTGRAALSAIEVLAAIGLPLVKNRKLVAVLVVHAASPRNWSKNDLQIVEEVAERTWAAVEQARAEAALRESEARFRVLTAMSSDWYWEQDENFRFLEGAEGVSALAGYSVGSIVGKTRWELPLIGLSEEQWAEHRALLERHEPFRNFEYSRLDERGNVIWTSVSGDPIFDRDGCFKGYRGTGRNITERKQAAQALATANQVLESRVADRTRQLQQEMKLREQTQTALAQSQRIEALGQLTGGIAHDFNNLLTVVSGNLELAEPHITDKNARGSVRLAIEAVEMGSSLNRRLLAFAHRRKLEPQRLILNERVSEMEKLLQRTLGEEVALVTHLEVHLWPTQTDPGEIDSAIINLAINARDAMPDGGTLTLETRNVTVDVDAAQTDVRPGDYVSLLLSDTGHGMTPEVQRRAIEPFFTTKETGKGTGLGLSSVYGFARQSGGFIDIMSEVGKGTIVRLLLPRAQEEPAAVRCTAAGLQVPTGDGELVLVVEDNEQVRQVTLARLESLGYDVLEARSGPEAIEVLNSGAPIALVFSDVVISGGMSGYDVARFVHDAKPGLKVLLTSGNEAPARREAGDYEDLRVLAKPYTRAQLGQAIRETLAG